MIFTRPSGRFIERKTMKQIYRRAKQLNPILGVIYFVIKIGMLIATAFEVS
jgi:hypothetical protein